MNHPKRLVSLLLACLLCLALAPLPLASAGPYTYGYTQQLAHGLTLDTRLSRTDAKTASQSFVLDYTPNPATTPIVLYGDYLYGRSDINTVMRYAESRGYSVAAAVNSDFFSLSTGLPTGMTIQDGRLCTSDSGWNAVAFFADGTAMCGAPGMAISMTSQSSGKVYPIYSFNRLRTSAGIYLLNADFDKTTRLSLPGTNVVLEAPAGQTLRLGVPLELTVVSVGKVTGSTPIGANQYVMTMSDACQLGLSLSDITVGEVLTLNVTAADSRWYDAVFSTGGGDMLMRNGVLTSAATSGAEPRTVLGVRPDGSFSVLVCDGRQPGVASGISLRDAANELAARGCTNIINLDGGGSSAMTARLPGDPQVGLISSPSDGAPRAGATYILFALTGDQSLPAGRVAVYPSNPLVLAGASLSLSAYLYNDDYYPMGAYSGGYAVTSGGGTVSGAVYTAPMSAGTATVDAVGAGYASSPATITIVDKPVTLGVVKSGATTPLNSLGLAPNEQVYLDVYVTDGVRHIKSQDTQFTYTLSGNVGTITPDGILTAAGTSGLTGTLTVSYGDMQTTIPVTVGREPVLLDGFENGGTYTAAAKAGTIAEALVSKSPENARYGSGSLLLRYAVAADNAPETVTFAAQTALTLPSGAQAISLLARGVGPFSLVFNTSGGATVSVPLALSGAEWQYLAVAVPPGAVSIRGFSAEVGTADAQTLYIDQLMCHFSDAAADMTPPVIELLSADNGQLTARVYDEYPLPMTAAMITLTLDGANLPFAFDAQTGLLTAALPADGTLRRLAITARDYYQNTARLGVTLGETTDLMFTDLNGHWAQGFAEYLRGKGIFSPDARFHPGTNTTNAMTVTLISRFLGVNTSLYDAVVLPYADAAAIPDWALPHARAMYQLGIMRGTTVNGVPMFLPGENTTRAQVMTVLGRTLPRGYNYTSALFADLAASPSWALDHINLLYGLGIVTGYGGTNTVEPQKPITRAEMASLLFKLR